MLYISKTSLENEQKSEIHKIDIDAGATRILLRTLVSAQSMTQENAREDANENANDHGRVERCN